MQGIVLELDLKTDTGLIRAEDGNRYEFKVQTSRGEPPLVGCHVDFELKDNTAHAIYTIKRPLKAKLDWLFWLLFYSRGRISRETYVWFLTSSVFILPLLSHLTKNAPLSFGFFVVMSLLTLHIFISVTTKRFHDSNASCFWLILTIVLGIILALVMSQVISVTSFGLTGFYLLIGLFSLCVLFCSYFCFAKGSLGKNRYGEEPQTCQTFKLK